MSIPILSGKSYMSNRDLLDLFHPDEPGIPFGDNHTSPALPICHQSIVETDHLGFRDFAESHGQRRNLIVKTYQKSLPVGDSVPLLDKSTCRHIGDSLFADLLQRRDSAVTNSIEVMEKGGSLIELKGADYGN